jgi:hypothetical protein
MPSTSKKQHSFMEAVAHNPSFAKKAGVPQSVGKDFSTADKGKTFKRGGDMAKANPFMEMIAKKKDMAGKKKDGMHKMPDGKMMKDSAMKHGGKVKKMAEGGMAMPKQSKVNVGMGDKYSPKPEQATVTMKKGGMASTATVNAGKKQSMNYDTKPGKSVSMSAALPRKMAKVDTNPSNINGVAKYGKTQGKTVKMNMGGKAR